MPEREKQAMNDHDLLIKLDTKVQLIIDQMKDFNEKTLRRVRDVEKNKLEKEEFNVFKDESSCTHGDFEKRLRSLEKFTWVALGTILVVEVLVVPVILKFIL